MQREYRTKVDMPLVRGDFSAYYSRVEKPSGIEYILLSIIQSKAYEDETWGSVMESMGIAENIFGSLFAPEIQNMNGNMISTQNQDPPSVDDYISDYKLTDRGIAAFSKGVIAVKPEPVMGSIVYRPGKLDSLKYRQESKVKGAVSPASDGRFSGEEIDPGLVEAYLTDNRRDFGITDATADIFDFAMVGDGSRYTYEQVVNLRFNDVSAEFEILEGDLDTNFVKNNFTAEDLIGGLSENHFESPMSEVRFAVWGSVPEDWESYSVMLPCEADFRKDMFTVCNPSTCVLDGRSDSMFAYDGLESDVLSVISSTVAYEYRFVETDIYVMGLEGEARRRVLFRRSVDPGVIKNVLTGVVGGMDLSDRSCLPRVLKMLQTIDDPDYTYKVIRKHLVSCGSMVGSIAEINKCRNLKVDLGGIAEDVLAGTELSMNDRVDVLRKSGTKVDGEVLAASITGGRLDRIGQVDALLTVSRNKLGILRKAGMEGLVRDIVMDGVEFELRSELSKAQEANRRMAELKGYLRMRDLQHYEFDIDELRDVCSDTFPTAKSALVTNINALKGLIPEDDMQDLGKYLDVFEDISQVMKLDVPLEKARGRMLGMKIGVMLEDIFGRLGLNGTLAEKIEGAHDKGMVDDADHKVLGDIREYRNICAHELVVSNVPDEDTRRKWVQLVRKLEAPKKDEPSPKPSGRKGKKR